MTPQLGAIRTLRVNPAKLAESRDGTWLGFHVAAKAPD
jgi:hypothetical protein